MKCAMYGTVDCKVAKVICKEKERDCNNCNWRKEVDDELDTKGLEFRDSEELKQKYLMINDLLEIGVLNRDNNINKCMEILIESIKIRNEFNKI